MTRGTIIRISEEIYLPQINSKHWIRNFGTVKRLAMLTDTPTNSGNAHIIYSNGETGHFNVNVQPFELVKEV